MNTPIFYAVMALTVIVSVVTFCFTMRSSRKARDACDVLRFSDLRRQQPYQIKIVNAVVGNTVRELELKSPEFLLIFLGIDNKVRKRDRMKFLRRVESEGSAYHKYEHKRVWYELIVERPN